MLIIEDEPVIAADIAALVKELGHRVTGIAATREEATAAAAADKPGLVLADIQLADGSSGIDAVRDILSNMDTPVIFITAFPERLLTGERPEPTFLITKPFQPETVKAAIGQALFFPSPAREGAPPRGQSQRASRRARSHQVDRHVDPAAQEPGVSGRGFGSGHADRLLAEFHGGKAPPVQLAGDRVGAPLGQREIGARRRRAASARPITTMPVTSQPRERSPAVAISWPASWVTAADLGSK